MTEAVTTLKRVVQNAILSFNGSERYLIRNDLSERCICARFAMHLTEALKGTEYSNYLVDVEYNRGMDGHEERQKESKRLQSQLTLSYISAACTAAGDLTISYALK